MKHRHPAVSDTCRRGVKKTCFSFTLTLFKSVSDTYKTLVQTYRISVSKIIFFICFYFSIVDGRINVKCTAIYSFKIFFNEKFVQLRCICMYFNSQFRFFIIMRRCRCRIYFTLAVSECPCRVAVFVWEFVLHRM
jgi:hypothetical protein